jgi:hypothetical protein
MIFTIPDGMVDDMVDGMAWLKLQRASSGHEQRVWSGVNNDARQVSSSSATRKLEYQALQLLSYHLSLPALGDPFSFSIEPFSIDLQTVKCAACFLSQPFIHTSQGLTKLRRSHGSLGTFV